MTGETAATSPYERLESAEGIAALGAIARFGEAQLVAAVAAARALADREVAAAALATVFARRRALAAAKFSRADAMFFTTAGYQQATSEAVARHRATRFAAHRRVADLCCGIGGDAIGIAAALPAGARVDGVDLDADAVACARHNACVYEVEGATAFHEGDAVRWPLRGCDAAFADPSRRNAAGRVKRASQYQPPLMSVIVRARELPGRRLGVKIAPGLRVREDALRDACGGPVELEYVSEHGVCKEAIVWCGDLARFDGARRATVITAGGADMLDANPSDRATVTGLRRFLGEPDPAIIRSGLLSTLCERLDAGVLDRSVAYLTADEPTPTPFGRWFEVVEALPFGVKPLRAWLRKAGIGELVIKTRAFPLRPEQIAALLKPSGGSQAVLVCTTVGGRKTAIVCRAPATGVPT